MLDLIKRANMVDAKPISTPMTSTTKFLSSTGGEFDLLEYCQQGCLYHMIHNCNFEKN